MDSGYTSHPVLYNTFNTVDLIFTDLTGNPAGYLSDLMIMKLHIYLRPVFAAGEISESIFPSL